MSKKVICFGEMLWDCFPDYEIEGGAPMNVALNLKQLGLDVSMISRLGNDEHGIKLREFVKAYGLPLELIQVDEVHQTSKVVVDNRDKVNIRYEILSPVAWDFIELTEANMLAVENADAFIFGSLAIRNNQSWLTLQHLLHHTNAIKIFDINLRSPFFDFDKIEIILGYTDILKINEDELQIVADHFGIALDEKSYMVSHPFGNEDNRLSAFAKNVCDMLCKYFPIKMICITLGSKGAMIYRQGEIFQHPGYAVEVEDTVGSGDAFLSGFVKTYLEGKKPDEILDFACALGAFVATKKGGTPKYSLEDVKRGIG